MKRFESLSWSISIFNSWTYPDRASYGSHNWKCNYMCSGQFNIGDMIEPEKGWTRAITAGKFTFEPKPALTEEEGKRLDTIFAEMELQLKGEAK